MSNRKTAETASGSRKGKPWMKNLIFALVVLVLAAVLYFGVRAAHSGKGGGLQAVVDFGDGITETLPLDTDHDYLYDVGDYVVHLQVKDGHRVFGQSVPGPCVRAIRQAGQGWRMGCLHPCRGVCGCRGYCRIKIMLKKGQCFGRPGRCLFCFVQDAGGKRV